MKKIVAYSCLLILSIIVSACHTYDNATTYYNTFYNAQRILSEAQDEFAFSDEKKRVTPRALSPIDTIINYESKPTGMPPFMRDYVIAQQKLQPVQVKVDSLIIKGSKILALHPKSDYIERTLYIMALAYWYRSEWLPSQLKCSELIDKYPMGEMSPDAHLLYAKNCLIQRKWEASKTALSRCVDIAWYKKRYDVLSDAFKLQAELALYEKDLDGALRPYLQAIIQVDDAEIRARWEVDLASLLYRLSRFEEAKKWYQRSLEDSPDYLNEFEAKLYSASCDYRVKKYNEAEKVYDKLDADRKYTEWASYISAERLKMQIYQNGDSAFIKAEAKNDTTFIGSQGIMTSYYEFAMKKYHDSSYVIARNYFAKAHATRSPVFETSEKMLSLLNYWEEKQNKTKTIREKMAKKEPINDSLKSFAASDFFEIGRIHEQLKNHDSAQYYYQLSVNCSNFKNEKTARYLYALAISNDQKNPMIADSLFQMVVDSFPKTEYGLDARKRLGYMDSFIIDSAADFYKSGASLRSIGDYNFAINQFNKVYSLFPKNPFAPRSLYSIGWIYEKKQINYDSAIFYYQKLIKEYPNSVYALDVKPGVEYLAYKNSPQSKKDSIDKLNAPPDSLNKNKSPNINPLDKQNLNPNKSPKDKANVDNNKLNPSSMLPKAPSVDDMKNTITNPFKKLIQNPFGIKQSTDSTGTSAPPDTTKH